MKFVLRQNRGAETTGKLNMHALQSRDFHFQCGLRVKILSFNLT